MAIQGSPLTAKHRMIGSVTECFESRAICNVFHIGERTLDGAAIEVHVLNNATPLLSVELPQSTKSAKSLLLYGIKGR